jgi:hypothetical protein
LQEVNAIDLDSATLDAVTDRVVAVVDRGERPGSAALLFLLRRYSSGARDDVAELLGAALAREIAAGDDHAAADPEAWLALFAEAAAVSDDLRLAEAGTRLVPVVKDRWRAVDVDALMRSIEACLLAVNLPEARSLAAEAIDALERAVAGAYRPGAGVSHQVSAVPFVRGGLADHVHAASTLLTAHSLSSRLPYAMLADELMQSVLRVPVGGPQPALRIRCEWARVCCRLAALHRDPEYQRTAVLAVDADYAKEAARTLVELAGPALENVTDASPFGLALAEWLDLQ